MNPISLLINADDLIKLALKEDIPNEDISTQSILQSFQLGEADLISKEDGIIAGLPIFERVFKCLDSSIQINFYIHDGDPVGKGQMIAKIRGDMRIILSAERTALNYLQRMSGIASYTHSIVQKLSHTKTQLLDTRKTTPNMRIFEKYAVKIGGGHNHRFNLSDGILLKDNHISAAGGIKEAIEMAKTYASFVRKIEVEVEDLTMVKEALDAGADIILLDNMDLETMKEAIQLIGTKAKTECSGNITKDTLDELLELGLDYISSGALTHSAPILDISLKNLHTV